MAFNLIEAGQNLFSKFSRRRRVDKAELPSSVEVLKIANSIITEGNIRTQLRRDYLQDVMSITPSMSAEEIERRQYNLSHVDKIARDIARKQSLKE